MPRTDTGNFNRFLTSLGLLLVGASFVIPYFFFRNTESLTISSRELNSLTDGGRTALMGRQDAIALLEPLVAGGAVLIGLAGVVLVVVGGVRLKSEQDSEDEETELRMTRARLEVQDMSPAERAEKATQKAEAEVEQEKDEAAVPPSPSTGVEPQSTASAGEAKGGPARLGDSLRVRAAEIARITEKIEAAFRDAAIGDYESKWQVRIGSILDEIQLDGVLESTDHQLPDVVVEIAVSTNPHLLRRNARNRANEAIALLARYRALTGRDSRLWLITVVPEEAPEDRVDPVGGGPTALRRAVGGLGEVTVMSEKDIPLLPRVFKLQDLDLR